MSDNKKKSSDQPSTPQGAKSDSITRGMCKGQGCKQNEARFGFCSEHYEYFKFGLINKEGKKVPDYERKFEHYLERQEARKVA